MKNLLFIISILFTFACTNGNNNEISPSNTSVITIKTLKIGDQLSYDTLKLIWSDEFNTDGLVNTTDWTYEKGYVRNREIQYYTEARPENCRIEGGQLIITGRKEVFPYLGEHEITSASIITGKKHSWKYGRFEIRAKVPAGKGPWPAFWAKGYSQFNGVSWPTCGEIDIMEYASKNPNDMVQNVIYGESSTNYQSKTKHVYSETPYHEDFHIYSLDWNNHQIAFAIDSIVTHVVEMNSITPNPFNQPLFILLNLALGASEERTMGGKLDVNCLPVEFKVDYVRIYQTK
jgi:beta-glucanase (GH16 family)